MSNASGQWLPLPIYHEKRLILRNQSLQNSAKFPLSELYEIIIPLFTNCKLLSETHCLHRFTIIFLLFEVCMSQFVIYREIRKTKILKSTNINVAVFFFSVSFAMLLILRKTFLQSNCCKQLKITVICFKYFIKYSFKYI